MHLSKELKKKSNERDTEKEETTNIIIEETNQACHSCRTVNSYKLHVYVIIMIPIQV